MRVYDFILWIFLFWLLDNFINVKSIRTTIENVLNINSYYEQASKISRGFRKCTGAKGAADKIEKMCK